MSDTVDAPMPEPVRRIEIFTGSGRRRKWLPEEKAAILEECDVDGETVCGVARRHGLTASQVFWWRRQAREAAKADCGGRRNEGGFVPVACFRRTPCGRELETLTSSFGFQIVKVTAISAAAVAEAYLKWARGFHSAGLDFGDCFAYVPAKQYDCLLLFVGKGFARTDVERALWAGTTRMRDLTKGSIGKHLVEMAAPIAAGMVFQTAYFLVDLYFVAHVGAPAIAGVGAAGNLVFLVLALTQMLSAGTLSLLSHAVGRKDRDEANLIFNQANALGLLLCMGTLAGFYLAAAPYADTIGAGPLTARACRIYLYFYIPGLALQFVTTALSSALRATGIVKPTMLVQAATLSINIVLAPVLIAGWGTGHPLGVAGAGLASSIAVAAGVAMLAFYFVRYESYVSTDFVRWRPRWSTWKRLLAIGIPAGGEFALMVVYSVVIYWVIRRFGTPAQAGFGTGVRLMQAIFLPGMALSFAVAPIAGQNFGAGQWERVRETLRLAVFASAAIMALLMVVCQWQPDGLVRFFTRDPRVVTEGALFLRIISWNFIASGIIFSCSGMFQALGNTVPSLLSSGSRLVSFVIPAVWLSCQPTFRIETLWYVSVASVALQAVISLLLVRREMRKRIPVEVATPAAQVAS